MITVAFSTRKIDDKFVQEIKNTSGLKNIEVLPYENNGEYSLTEIYNKAIQDSSNDIVVLCHDDIMFDTKSWARKLIKHFEESNYGILGVAGTTHLPASGKWWEDPSKMVGIVNHENEGKRWESKYCKNWVGEIIETVIVDGVFIAIHKERISQKFGTDINGFHFYDLDFCVSNYLKDVKIGVIFDVRITHKSVGQTNDQWETNREYFIEKYDENLPIFMKPEIIVNEKTNKFKVPSILLLQSTEFNKTKLFVERVQSFNYDSIKIVVISNDNNYEELQQIQGVEVVEGFFNDFPKNSSILKYQDEMFEGSELVYIATDEVDILNDVFYNLSEIYRQGKREFGCAFPLSFDERNNVLSTSLYITLSKQNHLGLHLNHQNSFHNYSFGIVNNPVGNFVNFICTTPVSLKLVDWFNINYEHSLFFNEFAMMLSSKKKKVVVDTNSLVIQNGFLVDYFLERTLMDFKNLNQSVQNNKDLHPFITQQK